MRELCLPATLTSALFAGLVAAVAGCPGPTPSHGEGAAGSTTSSGTGACKVASDCLGPAAPCTVPTCDEGVCGEAPAPEATPCDDASGKGKVCDGGGACVECLGSADCVDPSVSPCQKGVHTAPATCEQHACVAGEATDCAAAKLACTPTGCAPCDANTACDYGALAECKATTCTDGSCEIITAVASECAVGRCNADAACVPVRYVFVTSTPVAKGSMGSAQAADDTCREVAKKAELGGKWLSWTSDATTSPLKRFAKSQVPYMLLDHETVVAESWESLVDGTLVHFIDRDERGDTVAIGTHVWTGTTQAGTHSGVSCDGWSSNVSAAMNGTFGKVGLTDYHWTEYGDQSCGSASPLYCFQQ